ncbi:MAG: hypothetical protein MN733_15815 [Nitrososphaera sp.]|nr:hypothetical protein [Nitrososphaera sp.]
MNGVAALLLAAYLYSVYSAGRQGELYESVKIDALPFTVWLGAVAAIVWILDNAPKEVSAWFTALLVVGAGLTVGPQIISGFETVLKLSEGK